MRPRLIETSLMLLKSNRHINLQKFLVLRDKNIIIRKMFIADSTLLIFQCESITRNVQVCMAILADIHFNPL